MGGGGLGLWLRGPTYIVAVDERVAAGSQWGTRGTVLIARVGSGTRGGRSGRAAATAVSVGVALGGVGLQQRFVAAIGSSSSGCVWDVVVVVE